MVTLCLAAAAAADTSCFDELYRAGRFSEALPLAEEALRLAEQRSGPQHPDVASRLNDLAILYRAMGRYAEAEPLYRRALEIRERALGPADTATAFSLNDLALFLREQGRYTEAEPLHLRAVRILERLLGPDHPHVAIVQENLASLYLEQGRYAEAEPLYMRSIEIIRRSLGEEDPHVATALNNLATLDEARGRYAEAEALYRQSLDIRERVLGPDHAAVATLLNNLALLLGRMGRYAEAEPLYLRALAIDEKVLGPDHLGLAIDLGNLASLYRDWGRWTEAESLYRRSLVLYERALGPDSLEVAIKLGDLVELYRAEGRCTEAMPLFRRALGIYRRVLSPDHPRIAKLLQTAGEVDLLRADTVSAISKFREALDALAPGNDTWDGRAASLLPLPLTVRTLFSLAKAESSDTRESPRARLSHALATARLALDLLERMRKSMSREDRRFHDEQFRNLPGWILRLQTELQALGDPVAADLALRAAEVASAWSFLEMMAEARADAALTDALPPDLARAEHDLLSRIKWIDDRPGDTTLFSERFALEDSFTAHVDRLYREKPRYAALKYPRPASLETLRAALGPDEIALEYVVSADGAFVLALTRDSFILAGIGSKTDVVDDVSAYNAAIERRMLSAHDRAVLRRLHDRLLAPVANLIAGRKPIVAPADAIDRVSFPALLVSDSVYLGTLHEIVTIPSLSILALTRSWRTEIPVEARSLLALGDPVYGEARDAGAELRSRAYSAAVRNGWMPLPGTRIEVLAVARYFSDTQQRLFMGRDASESNVLAEDWRGYGYLHFACHGALEEGPGREPALVLSLSGNAPPCDGFLALNEVVKKPLRARTTVLSACNSGRRSAQSGSAGVSSLARAFLLTGSDAVIVSLWPVDDDATAVLMSEFYRAMREDGLTASQALRRAEEKLRCRPDWSAPAYWAPFICVGE